MRVIIKTIDGEHVEGTVALKDESFIMLRRHRDSVRVFHWDAICDIQKVLKGERQSIDIESFKKIRE